MERPIFVLITLNGQKGIGPRYVAAACEAAGLETHLLHFKLFHSREVSREESKRRASEGQQFVVRVHPQGDELVPYPRQATDEETELLIDTLRGISPTLIGLSFTSVDLARAETLTALLHDRLADVPVIWGGIHATLNPETAILHADIVCVGEGDEVIVEHLTEPMRRDLAGLWFRDGQRIIRNPRRPLIADLDSLAFPSYGGNEIYIDDNALHTETRDIATAISRNYQIVTARGCPFSCSFCLHGKLRGLYPGQKYLRRRSVENVIRELELRASQGFFDAFVTFYDEVFVKDPDWIAEFVPKYKQRVGLPFVTYSHERFSTPEMVETLHDAGMVATTLGFQSGSDRICRDIYNRRNDFDRIVALAHAIHERQLARVLLFEGLTNTPFETEDDCRATFEFLLRLPPPFYLQMFKLVLFPGTKIERLPRAENPLDENTFRFWNMLYLLTQSDRLPRSTIRALADDPLLRAQPGLLEDLVEALFPDDPLTEVTETLRRETHDLQLQKRAAAQPPPSRLRQLIRRVRGNR